MNLTQPAVTQRLAKLERNLGQRLFERRPDGTLPTAAALAAIPPPPRFEQARSQMGSNRVTAAQIRSFLDVIRCGGYAAAARRTTSSNASLHRAFGDLALPCGHALIERRDDGVVPTRKGQDRARRLPLARAELPAAFDELAALSGRETGRLVIGAMPCPGRGCCLPRCSASMRDTRISAWNH